MSVTHICVSGIFMITKFYLLKIILIELVYLFLSRDLTMQYRILFDYIAILSFDN